MSLHRVGAQRIGNDVVAALAQVTDEDVTPGLLGFLVVFGLALATWFLMRSMGTHLRRIKLPAPTPPVGQSEPADPADEPRGG